MRRKVEIIIDELVLHGFNPADRHAIGEALSAELERLVGEPGTNMVSRSRDAISAKTVSLAPKARPETVGAQVAQSVHGAITK